MKMSKLNLLLSAVFITGTAVNPAFAQDNDDQIDEIVVTGSRLRVNPNLTAANPVLTVGQQQIAARGTVNIEDLTNNLPQVFAGQASEVSNGASGTSTLNLRGLGATRTLTLIDGRRLPFGSSNTTAVNLDLVPTNLVERVEILTGGASAVYGSDAVAGVANFILKRDFEGIEADAQIGFAQNSNGISEFDEAVEAGGFETADGSTDGREFNASLTIGANTEDGKGNVTVFASYQDRNEITQDDRSFSACALGAGDGALSANGLQCAGSANFRLLGGPGGFGFQEEDGTVVPFVGGPAQTFNFGPFNFFQRPAERFQLYGRGHYEFAEGHEVFGDLSFVNNTSDAQIAPTASFGIGAFSINCDNPLIQGGSGPDGTGIALTDTFGCSAADIAAGNDVDDITASNRNVEGGARNSTLENSAFRLITGVRGTLFDNWAYEAFGQYSRTTDQSISTNDFVVANVQQSFFAVEDADGNIVCRDQSGGCVPFNIFQRNADGSSLITQEALDFVQGIGIVNGETDQFVVGGNVQTDLGVYGISSPYSDNGVALSLGIEYREDALQSRPDQISQIEGGGFTGVGGATLPVEGQVNVTELFGEVQIPLVTGLPFVQELTFSGQYRYSDYNTDGNGVSNSFDTNAYGLGLVWQPVEDIKLRGNFQRAVRAPNVIELFTGQNTGLPNLAAGPNGAFDPCAGPNPTATAAQCANTGVTAAQFGNILDVISGQTQSITGGNPLLNPEESDTFTVGAVFTPTFIDGFTASIDYFDISVDDFISPGIGAQTILDNCLDTGDATFCDLLQRDSGGSLNAGTPGVGFLLTNANVAEVETAGIDLQASYRVDPEDYGLNGWGTFDLSYASTILTDYTFTPFPGGIEVECEGNFGTDSCPAVNSRYRHNTSIRWQTPIDVNVTATWRHFSGVDNISDDAPEVDARLDTVDYIDLSGNYEIIEGVEFRAGINNLFLQQPPVSVSAGPALGNGNTFPTVYDTGRFFFFGLNVKL